MIRRAAAGTSEEDDVRDITSAVCPTPQNDYARIVLGHGSGGRLTHTLVDEVFGALFAGGPRPIDDQAILPSSSGQRLALTTDSFVVSPLFFPGGDIGSLAINGTVNDLAVGGARPLYVAAAFILEEGFELTTLRRVVGSMAEAAQRAEVRVVTGDTKVVERGKADGVFITTTGVGLVPDGRTLSAASAKAGDRILLSGHVGDHGITILARRAGIELETSLASDCAPLSSLVEAIFASAGGVRCMRDPTRGGVSAALNEIAEAAGVGMEIDERLVPVRPEVKGACELLGLDPLYIANEGKLVAIVTKEDAPVILNAMRRHPLGKHAVDIGEVVSEHPGMVTVRSLIGGQRLMPILAGEQLPRIC